MTTGGAPGPPMTTGGAPGPPMTMGGAPGPPMTTGILGAAPLPGEAFEGRPGVEAFCGFERGRALLPGGVCDRSLPGVDFDWKVGCIALEAWGADFSLALGMAGFAGAVFTPEGAFASGFWLFGVLGDVVAGAGSLPRFTSFDSTSSFEAGRGDESISSCFLGDILVRSGFGDGDLVGTQEDKGDSS